jgi:hypothetical protein
MSDQKNVTLDKNKIRKNIPSDKRQIRKNIIPDKDHSGQTLRHAQVMLGKGATQPRRYQDAHQDDEAIAPEEAKALDKKGLG